ncbi:hypothetical protein ACFLQ8_00960 [Candidatus Auribacterota bacterium]
MKKIKVLLCFVFVLVQFGCIVSSASADCGSCGSKLRKFNKNATTKQKERKKWIEEKRRKFGKKKKSLIKQRKNKGLHKQRRTFGH